MALHPPDDFSGSWNSTPPFSAQSLFFLYLYCLNLSLSVCLSVCLSLSLSLYIIMFVCFSACLSCCQSVYLPVSPWRSFLCTNLVTVQTLQAFDQISIISVLSKPLEKHINKHLLLHLNSYNLLHPSQSGFRKKASCQTALTSRVEHWLTNINNNEFNGAIFVDFKKAFDVIDHVLLLRKLSFYGMSDTALETLSILSHQQTTMCYCWY